jgi:hypothetical protein
VSKNKNTYHVYPDGTGKCLDAAYSITPATDTCKKYSEVDADRICITEKTANTDYI